MNKLLLILIILTTLLNSCINSSNSKKKEFDFNPPSQTNDLKQVNSEKDFTIFATKNVDKSIEEVLKLHFDHTGKHIFKETQTVVYKGKHDQRGSMVRFSLYGIQGEKLRFEENHLGEKSIAIINKGESFQTHIYQYPYDPGEISKSQKQSIYSKVSIGQLLFNQVQLGYKPDSIKMALVKNRLCYALFRKDDSKVENVFFIDTLNYNLVKYARIDKTLGEHVLYSQNYSNFVKRQGIVVPLRIENYMSNQLVDKFIVTYIEFNKELSDTLFIIPKQ